MFGVLIKVIFGLFIWLALPGLIYKKRKAKSGSVQFFVTISCKVVGIFIIALAVFDFIREALSV
ncbi:MAG: hypothetical protein ACO22X_07770 [Algoriphagus sp.]|jgi:hypothetical protein